MQSNTLIHNNLRMLVGGGKSSPLLILVAAVAAFSLSACAPKPQSQQTPDTLTIADLDSVFGSRDSLLYYAHLAYTRDDPKAQFITGAAPYLQREGKVPDWIYTLPLSQADTMLMYSAAQSYQPAVDFIGVLIEQGEWHHEY